MNKSLSNSLTLIFAVIGCLVSLLLTFGEHVASSATGCFRTARAARPQPGARTGMSAPCLRLSSEF